MPLRGTLGTLRRVVRGDARSRHARQAGPTPPYQCIRATFGRSSSTNDRARDMWRKWSMASALQARMVGPRRDDRVPPGTLRRMDVAVGPTLLFYAMGIVVVVVVVISAVWLGRGR